MAGYTRQSASNIVDDGVAGSPGVLPAVEDDNKHPDGCGHDLRAHRSQAGRRNHVAIYHQTG